MTGSGFGGDAFAYPGVTLSLGVRWPGRRADYAPISLSEM
jgi:hypothetical protein